MTVGSDLIAHLRCIVHAPDLELGLVTLNLGPHQVPVHQSNSPFCPAEVMAHLAPNLVVATNLKAYILLSTQYNGGPSSQHVFGSCCALMCVIA